MTRAVTRFAPSPTGDLHLGHVYAAWFARAAARAAGGRYLVRIEDIDQGRCRRDYENRNLDDLVWLGLAGDEAPVRQSERRPHYDAALDRLARQGVVYPCFCTRREIRAEIAAAGGAPHAAPDGTLVYPGTCRGLPADETARRQAAGEGFALRLDVARAVAMAGPLTWTDRRFGTRPAEPLAFGDVVVARKELGVAYHLAVVVDDALQGVTEVTRGEDLLAATHVHRLLYALLGHAPPVWHHHALVVDDAGERLATRRGGFTVAALRAAGRTSAEVLELAQTRLAGAAGQLPLSERE